MGDLLIAEWGDLYRIENRRQTTGFASGGYSPPLICWHMSCLS
jgi:hypothetical protein